MFKRFALIIFLSLLLFGSLFGWKFFQIRQMIASIKPPPPAVVAAADVRSEEWETYLTAVGSLTAVAVIEVSSEAPGKIKALHFDSDQSVQRGQLLVELDASTDLAELKGYQADQNLAKLKFARSQQLIGRNFISKSDYDLSKATLEQANAIVATKLATIAKKRITAPFTGHLGIRKINIGQFLAAGDSIVTLQKLQPVYADFTLPENKLGHVKLNQAVNVSVDAYPDRLFAGKISAINPGIDKATRSIIIRATLDNPEELLRPGMFVEVRLSLNANKPALTVPDTAITYNPYGDSVYIIEQDKQRWVVKLKQIKVGETRAGRVEVISGLNANERVVSAGQVKLRNGVPVTIDKQPAPGERGVAP